MEDKTIKILPPLEEKNKDKENLDKSKYLFLEKIFEAGKIKYFLFFAAIILLLMMNFGFFKNGNPSANQIIFGNGNKINNDLSTTTIFTQKDDSLMPKISLIQALLIPIDSNPLEDYFIIRYNFSFSSPSIRKNSFGDIKTYLSFNNSSEFTSQYKTEIGSGLIQKFDYLQDVDLIVPKDYDLEAFLKKKDLKAKVYLEVNGEWIESNMVEVILSD